MRRDRLWLTVCLAALLLGQGTLIQAQSLTIGAVTGKAVTVPVTMTSDAEVQGFVLAVAHDTAQLTATDVRAAGETTANNAELVVAEVLGDGFTLGVVMDFNAPYDGQVIPAGADLLIAEADLAVDPDLATSLEPGETVVLPLTFQDGLNEPPLNNIVVIDGMSISGQEGLETTAGSVTVIGKGDEVRIVSAAGPSDAPVDIVIETDNRKGVEGYVLSIQHDPMITLEEITTDGTAAGAAGVEFAVAKIYADGGTLGAVLDFDPPYDGQIVAPGLGNSLAIFSYTAAEFACDAPDMTVDLTFVDGVFGTPALANVLVEDGLSIPPDLVDGSVTFTCVRPTIEGINYYVGADTGGDAPEITCATGSAGAAAPVGLYYTSAEVPIQGMSMALTFPPELDVADLDAAGQGMVSADHIAGTITDGINAEFVSFNANNDTGELIVGILVDSTPPVPLNHMYPPTMIPRKVLTVSFMIPEGAECRTVYPLEFVNGLTGAGDVAISNRAAVFNESAAVEGIPGCLEINGSVAPFLRGDCNTDGVVDVADPAATMSYLYLGVFDPSCLDACDSNDDGVVDLADVVSTLHFLFRLAPVLPPPGPYVPGFDPTPDIYGLDLGCDAGVPCD